VSNFEIKVDEIFAPLLLKKYVVLLTATTEKSVLATKISVAKTPNINA
jgi:hypothetical protein